MMPSESRYDVLYASESLKKTVCFDDEQAFNDFHLVAAFRKLRRSIMETSACGIAVPVATLDTMLNLARECGRRGLDPSSTEVVREEGMPRAE